MGVQAQRLPVADMPPAAPERVAGAPYTAGIDK
jgi:hypothetical protein